MKKAIYNYQEKGFHPCQPKRQRRQVQLKKFESWMEQQNYARDTIKTYSNYTGCFLAWQEREGITTTQVNYPDMMEFIKHYQNQDSIGLLNRKLGAIRKYYEWLQYEGETEKNPASGIYLKGRKRSVPHDLLDRETLDQLYENYHVTDERTQRNKVILGLLIYQGLTTEELHKLEPGHLKLKSGKIEIPAGSKTQSRTLSLKPHQILELQEYLKVTRPQLLAKILNYDHQQPFYRAGRKVSQIDKTQLQRQLLISSNGSIYIKNTLKFLVRALQKINEDVKSAAQTCPAGLTARRIRQSVITEWLKTKDLRTVQYMAGHRYVSATERYALNQLEDLKADIDQHHPFKENKN